MPRIEATAAAPWGPARGLNAARAAVVPAAIASNDILAGPWPAPQPLRAARRVVLPSSRPAGQPRRAPWGVARSAAPVPMRVVWGLSLSASSTRRITMPGMGAAEAGPRHAPWGLAVFVQRDMRFMGSGGAVSAPVQTLRRSDWSATLAQGLRFWAPWGMGAPARSSVVVIIPPPDPTDPDETPAVPTRSTYIVINSVTLIRLPDNTALQAYSLSLKWDADSWSVGWSASLPATALDAVMPTGIGEPVELLATINGTAVRLLAESISRDRRFGDARLNVGGRGRVAWLADPYAPSVARSASAAMTSQQLAADALTDNGVSIGWGLDWQISDWLVPGGVWSHQGAMIDAVKRIAEAAGGYVLGHRTAQTLHVRPRYPLLPWEWAAATPDLIIPAAVASTEAIRWSESPAYSRVFVAGQEQGRMGQVSRAGTAGDVLAPMVTDPLITHADVARARGGSILAAGGRQAAITLRLPVLPETGILDLGQLIEYQDGSTARRGLVRAVSVDAAIPTVWQTVEIETHA